MKTMISPFARLAYWVHLGWLWLVRPLVLGVRVVALRDDKVLLVRHTYHPGWLLPGGMVKRGEMLAAAARREMREETGLELGEIQLQGVYTNFHDFKSDHVAVFTCRDLPSAPAHAGGWEIAEVGEFSIAGLPEELLPGHRRRIEEFLQGQARPGFGDW